MIFSAAVDTINAKFFFNIYLGGVGEKIPILDNCLLVLGRYLKGCSFGTMLGA